MDYRNSLFADVDPAGLLSGAVPGAGGGAAGGGAGAPGAVGGAGGVGPPPIDEDDSDGEEGMLANEYICIYSAEFDVYNESVRRACVC